VLLIALTAYYFYLVHNDYFTATWLTLCIICLFFTQAIGISTTLIAVCFENPRLLSVQLFLYYFYIALADFCALTLILTMAIGKRSTFFVSIPERIFNTLRFEAILGPFWIYLVAILLHITAAIYLCFLVVHKGYRRFLLDKLKHKST